jgi:type VI secretion system secreted protein VgrG
VQHAVAAFNQSYLVTSVQHSASNLDQTWGTGSYTATEGASTTAYYGNTFTAIPAAVQFRPPRATPKPRIAGLVSATVYVPPDNSQAGTGAAGGQGGQTSQSGQGAPALYVNPIPGYQGSSGTQATNTYVLPTPPMDSEGRYQVTLPFANGAVPGSSGVSAWIRMAQPTTGLYTGVQFTLEPGAEVLLAFVNGDPDLPVIVGSVYNGAIPAPLTAAHADPQV